MNFNNPYNREDFAQFIQNFLPDDFTPEERIITDTVGERSRTNNFIQAATKLGVCKSLDLEVFEVAHTSTHNARVGLSREAFMIMQNHSYSNRALFAFVPNDNSEQWRFSLLHFELEQKDESARLTKNYSNPRRYSFLLGEDSKVKTPQQYLCKEGKIRSQRRGNKDYTAWEDLCYRFSVETLTKEFYAELSNWYFWALQNVDFPNDEKQDKEIVNATAVIRLITRLMFVWFLKQKKLIKDELFDLQELDDVLNYNDKTGSTFYKAILQNLFFATLNTEMGEKRKFVHRQSGIQGFYRYERFFKSKERFLELTKDTPFLNGGLFENLDKNVGEENEIRIDCFSNRIDKEQLLKVPDFLFFGDEKQVDLNKIYDTKGKTYKVRGLIDILKTYHFTIEENTPTDIEVALDPELLGKVFENLLASFNPETQTTARKQTGSFYTPREIVDYMVQESLTAYLQTITNYELRIKSDGDIVIADGTPLTDEMKSVIINALNVAKILDPACGSGAFPMGILQKMVAMLQKLDPQNKLWKQRQLDIAEKIEDVQAREAAIENIEEAFEENTLDYGRKLFLIENCIFGIDIQPIAVQISKLRFFISLICEQTPKPEKPNLGIRPLPNLETKFVAANTLIGLDKPAQTNMFRTQEIINKENDLKDVRHKHFSARTPETKVKYREKDRQLRYEIAEILTTLGYAEDTAQKLALWNPYDQNASSAFFDAEWMFGVNEGFDVVIGNPPYVNVENLETNMKNYLFKNYDTCKGRTDIYIAFLEKSLNLIKENGIYLFIIPYAFTNQNYGSLMRKLLVDKYFVKEILDTSEYYVFENAVVKNIILSIIKTVNHENTTIKIAKSDQDFQQNDFQISTLNQNTFLDLKDYRFETKDISNSLLLKNRILKNTIRLDEICLIAYGARLNHKTEKIGKENYIFSEFKESYKPFTEGKNIDRFSFSQYGWLNYQPEEHYNSMFPELFENEKIMFINVVKDKLRFAFDDQNYYNSHTVINCVKWNLLQNANHSTAKRNLSKIKINNGNDFDYKFLLGVLNSRLINWYFVNFLSESLHFYPDDAKELPIPIAEKTEQQPIINLVNQILSAKQENPAADTAALERKIDRLVYGLYGLTEGEVGIIDK